MLALSMGILALIGVLVPAGASAQTAMAVQAVSTADAAAVDFEWDFAVAGTPPPRSQLACHSTTPVEICWEKAGDHWWVRDLDSTDNASTGVRWYNDRNGSLYRKGYCITSLGKGNWGHCNKNYYENSQLSGYPCIWNRSAGHPIDCSTQGWGYQ
jgi:hypothetical protein